MYSAMSLILLIELNKIDVFFIWWLIISFVWFVFQAIVANQYFKLYELKNSFSKIQDFDVSNKSAIGFFLSKGKKGQSMFSAKSATDITSLANVKKRKISTQKHIAVIVRGNKPKSLFLYKITLLD
jgi:hypothetical protein